MIHNIFNMCIYLIYISGMNYFDVIYNKLQLHFGVNYLGHFLLTDLLYDRLVASGTELEPSRVINVSSDGHRFTLWHGQDVDHPQGSHRSRNKAKCLIDAISYFAMLYV